MLRRLDTELCVKLPREWKLELVRIAGELRVPVSMVVRAALLSIISCPRFYSSLVTLLIVSRGREWDIVEERARRYLCRIEQELI